MKIVSLKSKRVKPKVNQRNKLMTLEELQIEMEYRTGVLADRVNDLEADLAIANKIIRLLLLTSETSETSEKASLEEK